jgi:HK97 family phage prohead protease
MELQRFNCGLDLKLAGGSAEAMEFSGYGAVFGNVDSYGDVISPGAFAETLAAAKAGGHWPVMLSQHGGFSAEDMTPIGVWTDLSEDGVGLRVTGKLANTPRGREAYELLKMTPRAAIDGMSIGYIAKEWTPRTKPEEPRRTLKKIDLYEISLVTFPANGKARVKDVKSLDDLSTLADVEDFLRDAGNLSRSQAKTIISRVKAFDLRDADDGGDYLRGLVRRIKA